MLFQSPPLCFYILQLHMEEIQEVEEQVAEKGKAAINGLREISLLRKCLDLEIWVIKNKKQTKKVSQ